ncbi:sulfate transporter family-domain-containing protein [Phlyctochytrium arcticum]|nr:sulfate transporter family-domain-containing protein [Phlyctochytrium arcticum]
MVATQYPTQYEQFAQRARQRINLRKTPAVVGTYLKSLFPIISWLPKYNRDWLYGDLIAGLTVGMVIIPQALAYAKLATLPLEYGLYTSFTGVLVYCLFATSKDVTIGATAVVSQLTGQILATYNTGPNAMPPVSFAVAVAFLTGLIQLVIGLLRLGIVVDFIPAPVIAGFTSGAGLGIIIGQFAGLLGIRGVNTNDPAYRVLGITLGKLGETKLDAAYGFSALAALLLIKFACQFGVRRGYTWLKWVGLARNAFVIIVFTAISYGANKDYKTAPIKIVGAIPKGFGPLHVPDVNNLSRVASASITVVIVSILEHIAVVKSYGRLNGYRPDANQELIALGVTNFAGSFFGGFPATGSFSRSAIKSQSGVRTPLAALFTAAIVVLALYVLTPLFFWIPSAVLSAIIIAAISDLISRPALVRQLWDIQFLDLVAFLLALLFTIFFSIEVGIYVSVGFAVAVLLYRLARPHYQLLARANDGLWVNVKDGRLGTQATPPPPGILVFRLEESLTYPNANYFAEHVKEIVIDRTEYGGPVLKANQRLWCDDTEDRIKKSRKTAASNAAAKNDFNTPSPLPHLRGVVFDMSAVNGLDTTGVQTLVDLRRDIDAYAGYRVPIHFAHVKPRFERILEYFLAITRTDREISPVVPEDDSTINDSNLPSTNTLVDLPSPVTQHLPSWSSKSNSDSNKTPIIDVRQFFHPTVDAAVSHLDHSSILHPPSSPSTDKEVSEIVVTSRSP